MYTMFNQRAEKNSSLTGKTEEQTESGREKEAEKETERERSASFQIYCGGRSLAMFLQHTED